MFTFKLYLKNSIVIPPNKAATLDLASMMAANFLVNYEKVEIIRGLDFVVKTLTNPNPIYVEQF